MSWTHTTVRTRAQQAEGLRDSHPCPPPLTEGTPRLEQTPVQIHEDFPKPKSCIEMDLTISSRSLLMHELRLLPTKEVTFHVLIASLVGWGSDHQGLDPRRHTPNEGEAAVLPGLISLWRLWWYLVKVWLGRGARLAIILKAQRDQDSGIMKTYWVHQCSSSDSSQIRVCYLTLRSRSLGF